MELDQQLVDELLSGVRKLPEGTPIRVRGTRSNAKTESYLS